MDQDAVNARIAAIFDRQGISPAPVAVDPEAAHTSNTVDATVYEPAGGLQFEPTVEIISAPSTRLLAPQEVVIPAGAPILGLAVLQFQAAWSTYVEETGQLIQPTLADAVAWFERELNTPEVPSAISHLIQVSGETMAEIQARSQWHSSPVRNVDRAPRGGFADMSRPQE
jgi:hypothetical protein